MPYLTQIDVCGLRFKILLVDSSTVLQAKFACSRLVLIAVKSIIRTVNTARKMDCLMWIMSWWDHWIAFLLKRRRRQYRSCEWQRLQICFAEIGRGEFLDFIRHSSQHAKQWPS